VADDNNRMSQHACWIGIAVTIFSTISYPVHQHNLVQITILCIFICSLFSNIMTDFDYINFSILAWNYKDISRYFQFGHMHIQ
jgi:hypothetical protein